MDALQIAGDRIVDEPGQLLDRKPRRRSRVSDDRQALDIDAADDRLVDGARQIAADLGDLVLHVVERTVDVDRADLNWITVDDDPSVAVEMMCQTPLMLETASSTFFVTCDSSSDGAALDWVMST